MTATEPDPLTACDRLAVLFERASALEDRERLATNDAVRVPVVPYAIALLRMRVRPALEPEAAARDPIHVVLFGGTNTGKSTVLNVLLGRAGAGMSVRARFSQHPEAFRPSALGTRWLDDFPTRFPGYRRYEDEHPPHQSDDELTRDGYRPAFAVLDVDRLPARALAAPAAPAVFWDAPDFSTEQAWTYLRAVIDAAALADIVLLTVTDESYADDRGNALLRMLGASSGSVQIVANKLPDSPTLLDDLTRTLHVNGRTEAPIYTLPFVRGGSPVERLSSLLATPEAEALRAAIAREARPGGGLKGRGLRAAVSFLEAHLDDLLRPLASEAEVAARWDADVARVTEGALLDVYRRDYLEGERYAEFHKALGRVMELIQVPWIGPALDFAGRVVRVPTQYVLGWLRKLAGTAAAPPEQPPENAVLHQALAGWHGALKAEAQARNEAGAHPAWAEVVRALDDDDARKGLFAGFEAALPAYHQAIDDEVRRRAEAITARLKANPKRLHLIRGANLGASALTVGLVVKSGGLDWSDALLGPVVAGFWQNLLEWGLGRYLDTQRAGLKQAQLQMLKETVETHLERPVRALFRGAARGDELAAARRDFELISAAARRTSTGGG